MAPSAVQPSATLREAAASAPVHVQYTIPFPESASMRTLSCRHSRSIVAMRRPLIVCDVCRLAAGRDATEAGDGSSQHSHKRGPGAMGVQRGARHQEGRGRVRVRAPTLDLVTPENSSCSIGLAHSWSPNPAPPRRVFRFEQQWRRRGHMAHKI